MGFVRRLQARLGHRRTPGVIAPPRRTGVDVTVGVAIAVVLVIVAPAAVRLVTPQVVPGTASPVADTLDPPLPAGSEFPPLPADSLYPARVLPPVSTAADGERVFLGTQPDGSPIGFDPCRPIHYVLNPDWMPDGAEQMLRESVAEISAATGLALVDDGVTTERIDEDRPPIQPLRYGERWAPVLIGWVGDSEVSHDDEEAFGTASQHVVAPSGTASARYVTGWVALNRAWFAEALAEPGTAAVARGVMLHELGHLVGLDHAIDPTQVMHATSDTTGLGQGDRAGLAAVGAGECHSDT